MSFHRLTSVGLAIGSLLAPRVIDADILTVCPSGCDHVSIQDAIDAAGEGDEIRLESDLFAIPDTLRVTNKQLLIVGSGSDGTTVIDGLGTHQVLLAEVAPIHRLELRNLVIRNGRTDSVGGGLFINGTGFDIVDCRFESNDAEFGGGAVNLVNYTAGSGPEPDRITGCTFDGNSTGGFGGAVRFEQTSNPTPPPLFDACVFLGNDADDGGAIHHQGMGPILTLQMTGCTFEANTGTQGGAIGGFLGDIAASGCTFSTNAAESGGAIHFQSGMLGLTDCAFTGNSATSEAGAVRIAGATASVISGCTFQSNESSADGLSLVARDCDLSLEGCTFSDHQVDAVGLLPSVISASGGSLDVLDCEIRENLTRGLLLADLQGSMTGCLISGHVGNGEVGAGMYLNNCQWQVRACRFEDNGGTAGGAINVLSPGHVRFDSCLFQANQALAEGGAIRWEQSSAGDGTLEIESCDFLGNTAQGQGGAIYLQGRLAGPDDLFHIADCRFEANEARDGGAVYGLLLRNVTVAGTDVVGNTASGDGGGIVFYSLFDSMISDTRFTGNAAGDAGGGFLATNSDLSMVEVLLQGNTAAGPGGGIASTGGELLVDGVVRGNIAGGPGGGWFSKGTATNAVDAVICGNTPDQATGVTGVGCLRETCCPGDADCDQAVDAADLGVLISHWGGWSPRVDFNGDGEVDGVDLAYILGYWGQCL